MSQKLKQLSYPAFNTLIMSAIMITYNAILAYGFNTHVFVVAITQWVPIFIAAFLIGQLVITHNARRLHKILVSEKASQQRRMISFTLLMVTGMCLSMSLYTTLISVGTGVEFWGHLLQAVAFNYPVALFSQMFIAGPAVGWLHKNTSLPTAGLKVQVEA